MRQSGRDLFQRPFCFLYAAMKNCPLFASSIAAMFCGAELFFLRQSSVFAAMTSMVFTATILALFARWNIFAMVTAIRSPVKLPGPMER